MGEPVTVDISEGDRYVETDPKKDKHFTKGRSGGNENARASLLHSKFYLKVNYQKLRKRKYYKKENLKVEK